MAKLTIRFEVRKDKVNQKGLSPISCIISVSQSRKRISIGQSILLENWDSETEQVCYVKADEQSKLKTAEYLKVSDVNLINLKLGEIKTRLDSIETNFQLDKIDYSVQDVYDKYLEYKPKNGIKTSEKVKAEILPTVPEFIDTYIERNRSNRAKRSLSVYSQLKTHLRAYEASKNKIVTFDIIGLAFFEDFQNYLVEERTTINNVTIAKQMSTLKTLLGYARRHGIDVNQSYRDFKIKKQKLEVITLTEGEYKSIKQVDLKGIERLEKTRDIFIFLCSTSMRYSDYAQFQREHIKGQTIQLTMKKGTKPWEIPLNPDSLSILEKYKDLHEPLPKISNQKLSSYIKEVCELAQINETIEKVRLNGAVLIKTLHPKFELIASHTGRKTFCTLSLERGASVETVMKWSGHESYASFKRYVNLSRTHSISEMERVWGTAPTMKIG